LKEQSLGESTEKTDALIQALTEKSGLQSQLDDLKVERAEVEAEFNDLL